MEGLLAVGFTGKDSTEVSDVQMFSTWMGYEKDMLKDTDKSNTKTAIEALETGVIQNVKLTMYPGVRGVSGESWW